LTVSRLKLTMNGLTAKGNTMKKSHLHLIKWGLAEGYTIEVYGEGELDYTGTSYKEAKENAEACDETEIVLRKGQEEGTWFLCNNFNDEPDEIVADYSDNEVGHAWQKAYDTECYGELCKNQ